MSDRNQPGPSYELRGIPPILVYTQVDEDEVDHPSIGSKRKSHFKGEYTLYYPISYIDGYGRSNTLDASACTALGHEYLRHFRQQSRSDVEIRSLQKEGCSSLTSRKAMHAAGQEFLERYKREGRFWAGDPEDEYGTIQIGSERTKVFLTTYDPERVDVRKRLPDNALFIAANTDGDKIDIKDCTTGISLEYTANSLATSFGKLIRVNEAFRHRVANEIAGEIEKTEFANTIRNMTERQGKDQFLRASRKALTRLLAYDPRDQFDVVGKDETELEKTYSEGVDVSVGGVQYTVRVLM
jgi:hypothetical protein